MIISMRSSVTRVKTFSCKRDVAMTMAKIRETSIWIKKEDNGCSNNMHNAMQ